MKIKRFQAKNMRDAIRLVRDEQGPEAVILSNRRVEGGIEVVAAVDYDASLLQQMSRAETPAAAPAPAPMVAPKPASQTAQASAHRPSAVVAQPKAVMPVAQKPVAVGQAPEVMQIRNELNSMRRLMERQLAGVVFNDMKQRQPERIAALNALHDLGIDPELARLIASQMPEQMTSERARYLPMGLLTKRIPVLKDDFILEGGVFALVGPTGVGKTTTLAKLAARYAQTYGTRDIALVTTDHYRIGAQEQLFTYGRLLGIPVHTASNADELSALMKRLADRRLILIDTAGMSPRDRNLAAQFSELKGVQSAKPIKTLLVLAANSQAGALHETVNRFGATPLAGCILTKVDEATRIGGALSVVIRRALPIAYLTDGQRVPEDIHMARADRIVIRAMQLSRQHPADVDDATLAMNFSGAQYRHA